ncbi:MAG: CHAP domain-containing protein, partial [Clostridia bacterium]|nr:CHAP domain-containing protein [Clostridia bacterium]
MSARKAKRTVTRLRFTEEERANPELKASIKKVDKAAEKLDQATKKAKSERLGTRDAIIPMDSIQKPVKLQFEDLQIKKSPSLLKSTAAALPAAEVHRQITRTQDDNVGVESAHKLEETTEGTVRTVQNAHRSHALKTQRKVLKSESKLDRANLSYLQKNAAKDQAGFATNPLSRWQQRQAIKKEYAAAKAGKSTKTVQQTAETARKAAKKTAEVTEKVTAFVARHKKAFLGIIGIFFIVVLIMNTFASCSQMAIGGLNAFLTTSYT